MTDTITFDFETPGTLSNGFKLTLRGTYEVVDTYWPEPDVGLSGESGIYVLPIDQPGSVVTDDDVIFVTHREMEKAER